MKKLYYLFSLFLVLSFVFYNGCGDDDPTDPGPGGGGETVTTTISGTVFDETNNPIAGVEVKSASQTAVTNSSGSFIFSNIVVPKNRFVVNTSKNGYFDGSVADVPKANGSSTIKIYMIAAGVTATVSAASGGNVAVNNGTGVELAANSIAKGDGSTYNGSVNVSVAYLDPTSESFANLIPGGDLQAQRTDNSQATLYSYGIIKVEMKTDAGEDLQIKSGNSSTITVDIPPDMEATAPATIPLWYYDKNTGLWKEEGTATKQGDKYIGTVGHFSDWNCDVPEGTATIRGLVVDCNNLPVPGISVKIGQASATTGSDGKFERRVPASTAFDVQVLGTRNFGLTSTVVSVPALAEGTVRDVGTLTVQCPVYIRGLLRCAGEVKKGQVVISWDGGYSSSYTANDGSFRIPVDIGKNAQVFIYTFDNKYKNMTITTPSNRGDSLDLGTVEVCEQGLAGDNKFTVDGSGFSNRTFTFSNDTLVSEVFSYYDLEDSLSWVWMYQVFQTDTVMMWVSFKGNNVGPASEVFLYFFFNSSYYYGGSDFPNATGVVNVTKYEGIGGIVEGTFSGNLINLLGGTGTVSISGGKFSVIRRVTGEQITKFQKNRIPPPLLNKYF